MLYWCFNAIGLNFEEILQHSKTKLYSIAVLGIIKQMERCKVQNNIDDLVSYDYSCDIKTILKGCLVLVIVN